MIDFCGDEKMGQGDGQIIQHRVAKGKISRMAPGMFIAARKAGWGGLWPDINSLRHWMRCSFMICHLMRFATMMESLPLARSTVLLLNDHERSLSTA